MIIFVTASADTYITNRKTQYIDAKTSNVGRAATLDLFKLYNENDLLLSEGSIVISSLPAAGDTVTLVDSLTRQVVFEFVDEVFNENNIGENKAGSNNISIPLKSAADTPASIIELSVYLNSAINNVTSKTQNGPAGNLALNITSSQSLNKLIVKQGTTGEKGDNAIVTSTSNIVVQGFSRIEESKILLKFNLDNLEGNYFSLSNETIRNSFSANLVLKDVTSGHTKPRNIRVTALPLKNSFNEGLGRDTSGFSDGDISNYLTASKDSSTGNYNLWNHEGAKLEGFYIEDVDLFTKYTVNAVDKNVKESSGLLVEGDEDLKIDITNYVSGVLTSNIVDNGIALKVHDDIYNNTNSYFVKRFGSRHLLNKTLVPRIEISFNDSKFFEEGTETLYFDTAKDVFYNHSINGVLSNIVTHDPGDTLKLKFFNPTFSFTSGEVDIVKRTNKLNEEVDGAYKASVTNTLVSQFDANLVDHIQASGSLNLTGSWYINRVGESDDFILKNQIFKFSVSDNEYSSIKNLRTKVLLEDDPLYADNTVRKIKVYFIDTLKKYKPYKVPYALKSLKFNSVKYDVIDVDTNETIISGENDSTKLVYDMDSYMFDMFVPDIFKNRRIKFKFTADGKTIDTEQIFRLQ